MGVCQKGEKVGPLDGTLVSALHGCDALFGSPRASGGQIGTGLPAAVPTPEWG